MYYTSVHQSISFLTGGFPLDQGRDEVIQFWSNDERWGNTFKCL